MKAPSWLNRLKKFLPSVRRGHYVVVFLFLVLLIVSIKPTLFTWNFLLARLDTVYLYKALHYNQAEYLMEKIDRKQVMDAAVQFAVRRNKPGFFKKFASPAISLEDLNAAYRDNFYFQDLLGRLREKRDWQNLDEVSFALLAEPGQNPLTVSIIDRIGHTFDARFVENLTDYCRWRQNDGLTDYLVEKFHLPERKPPLAALSAIPYPRSRTRLKEILESRLNMEDIRLGPNLIEGADFEDPAQFQQRWEFCDLAGIRRFAPASFYAGWQQQGNEGAARLMGFFFVEEAGKLSPRGGIRCHRSILLERGVYVFSFDYFTRIGREGPSFYLWDDIKEPRIPAAQRDWKKAVFLLDNHALKFDYVRPLIRMWGVGTVLFDNVYLGKWQLPESDRAGLFKDTPWIEYYE